MEVIYDNLVGQELVAVDTVQLKSEHKAELPTNAKKVMGVTCQVLAQTSTVQANEVTIGGNLVMRLVFINELDKYDSQDIVQPYEKKLTVKDLTGISNISGDAQIMSCQWDIQDNALQVSVILNVTINGVKEKNTRLVSDLAGEVEVRKLEQKILTFNAALDDQFEIEEQIDLDSNCEGVLGVDTNAFIKDVAASEGKVAVKGVVAVNIIGVKTVDGNTVPYNTVNEIEFAKSLVVTGTTAEDLATGAVKVNGVNVHVENGNKGSILVLKIELKFRGCSYVYKNCQSVVDAISFDKELAFETSQFEHVEILPQVNTTVDLENNMNLPANMPYLARVLAVDGVSINNLEVNAADGKAVLTGVLVANVLVENEEHLASNYLAEAPFQTHVRWDALDGEYQINATVVPLLLNVKARRGVELLLDAKLGISLQASTTKVTTMVTSVVVGKDKTDDGSAIRIYIIGDKENLWDLAKRTNLSCAELLKQNPNLENGCTPGERIVVYRHEKVAL